MLYHVLNSYAKIIYQTKRVQKGTLSAALLFCSNIRQSSIRTMNLGKFGALTGRGGYFWQLCMLQLYKIGNCSHFYVTHCERTR